MSYTHDTWGRVATQTDALNETTTFGYDADSNLVSQSDSKGTTTYAYDALGRVVEIDDSDAGTTTITYHVDDGTMISTMTYPNGITATTALEEGTGRVAGVWYEDAEDTLGFFERSYDPMGRVTLDASHLIDRGYIYDGTGRLVEVNDYEPGTEDLLETRQYEFDANTNRTELTVTPAGSSPETITYEVDDDGSDRLLSVDEGATFDYDDNGNTVAMASRDMTWTADNRLVQVNVADGPTINYNLDPLGRILEQTSSDGVDTTSAAYHYANDADIPSWIADTADTATVVTRYVNGIEGLHAIDIDGAVRYPLFTPHGDTWLWTDDQGDPTSDPAVFDEYGNPLTNPDEQDPPGAARYGWLGYQQRAWIPEAGITLMGVRGYDPTLGRFLSVDPVRGGSANDYDYVACDPVNDLDLMGTASLYGRARSWIYRNPCRLRAYVGWGAGGIFLFSGFRYAVVAGLGLTGPAGWAAVALLQASWWGLGSYATGRYRARCISGGGGAW